MMEYPSWGLYPKVANQTLLTLEQRNQDLPQTDSSILPRGLGRSYGDSCLNENGTLISNLNLNHMIEFNSDTGILRCEAGVSLNEILQFAVPRGWFLSVSPGTKFVTVGGAIANDVHGKNHGRAGNFGHHTLSFELLRSNGERLLCSRNQNPDYFHATVGGMGLTGFITWAEIQLKKIPSSYIAQEQIQFYNLQEFFELSQESDKNFAYVAGWVDCVNGGNDVRGIIIRGNYSEQRAGDYQVHRSNSAKTIPTYFPDFALNPLSIRAFNLAYYHKNIFKHRANTVHYEPFFYPLDSVNNWNKIYGRRGFLQYQVVVPYATDNGQAIREIMDLVKKSQMGSFLVVLKTFGSIKSEGMMSFPREGVTLALDFANYGPDLLKFLDRCDVIVRQAGGAIYPAKDARMSKESFAQFYPRLNEFEKFIDPKFSSSFWRRVT